MSVSEREKTNAIKKLTMSENGKSVAQAYVDDNISS